MLALPFRILWQYYPNIWCCCLFWFVATGVQFWGHPAKYQEVAIVGLLCNAVVTIANGGKMPVIGWGSGTVLSVWRPAQPGDRFLMLCDRFWGFSIGDFMIIAGMLLMFFHWLGVHYAHKY